MVEYVRMPKADYVAACNSIRAKTGKSDVIKSGAMSAEIDSITGGGGGSADERVKYVTFMYGATELYKQPVIAGDTCKDPYANNLISVPTKESDVGYDYTFNGWSLIEGGSANSTALQNVTEDRTVYAAFKATARKYTVTWLDSDGTTVLKTEQVAYGTVPSCTPEKDGYELTGWTPAITRVTGDAVYTAQWEEMVVVVEEIADDWDTIIASAADGSYKSKYKVGNYKLLTVDSKEYRMQIVAKDTDVLADGSGVAPLTFITDVLRNESMVYLESSKNIQNEQWGTSNMRTEAIPTKLTANIPENILSAIKEVKKYTLGLSNGELVEEETSEKIWVPSEREVFGTGEAQGVIYTSYVTGGLPRTKDRSLTSTTKRAYPLRSKMRYYSSANSAYLYSQSAVTTAGEYDVDGIASTWSGLVMSFCI